MEKFRNNVVSAKPTNPGGIATDSGATGRGTVLYPEEGIPSILETSIQCMAGNKYGGKGGHDTKGGCGPEDRYGVAGGRESVPGFFEAEEPVRPNQAEDRSGDGQQMNLHLFARRAVGHAFIDLDETVGLRKRAHPERLLTLQNGGRIAVVEAF